MREWCEECKSWHWRGEHKAQRTVTPVASQAVEGSVTGPKVASPEATGSVTGSVTPATKQDRWRAKHPDEVRSATRERTRRWRAAKRGLPAAALHKKCLLHKK